MVGLVGVRMYSIDSRHVVLLLFPWPPMSLRNNSYTHQMCVNTTPPSSSIVIVWPCATCSAFVKPESLGFTVIFSPRIHWLFAYAQTQNGVYTVIPLPRWSSLQIWPPWKFLVKSRTAYSRQWMNSITSSPHQWIMKKCGGCVPAVEGKYVTKESWLLTVNGQMT